MKFKVIFFILFSTILNVEAQVLTSSLAPANGDLYTFYNVDTLGAWVNVNDTTGTWNFNYLTSTGPESYIYYVQPSASSSTPYDTAFPNANLASTSDFVSYNYFNMSADSFSNLGNYSPSLGIKYTDPFKVFSFPFALGSSFVDTCMSGIFLNGGYPQTFNSKTINYCNKVGTLLLGNISYSNVMLVRSSQNIVYTTYYNGQPYVYTTQKCELYSWYDGLTKFPMVDYLYIRSNNSWETTWTEGAYYMRVRKFLLTGEHETNIQSKQTLILDQNNFLHLNSSVNYSVFDLGGRIVKAGKANQVDLSMLEKGIYIVGVSNSKNDSFTQKVIVR
jgi:hypothetical protein